ncbi:hypothetical protein [Cellulomonas sp. KRMCY2]|uniref:hypothetical protein n=1 Tax=Cellulomonas sp. KRMCY2 TaxID=1304865 RepID=UPI00045E6470|nr:hypothetical protein [Cellulomonas sp. KRMCY2]
MTGLPSGSAPALEPVRRWLRDTAEEAAAELGAAAVDEVAAVVAAAREEAERIRRDAAAQGAAEARSAAALRSAQVRRRAGESVLAQQEALRLALRRDVAHAATALLTDPRYPDLVDRLTAHARAVLGADATVVQSVDGGVVAERGSRRLDLSLPVLAAQALDARQQEVERLWAP